MPTATHNPNPPEPYVRLKAEREEDKPPVELIGGYEALYSQLQYPAEARKKGIKGHVMLQLTIDPQGVPQDVVVVQSLGAGCDEEALRIMRAARFTNASGQDHEVRMRLPFLYVAAAGK